MIDEVVVYLMKRVWINPTERTSCRTGFTVRLMAGSKLFGVNWIV